MEITDLLETLTTAFGVSGMESCAGEVAKNILKDITDEVEVTSRGTVIGKTFGDGPSILLDAHLDQVGYIVTYIAENGFLKFDKCGGTDERILSGLEVIVFGKKPVYGVVSSIPPHLADSKDAGKAKSEKDLFIDTGLTDEEAAALISQGDRVIPVYKFAKLLNNEVSSGALDDRSGMAVLIKAVELINDAVSQGRKKPNLTISFSVQEEVGGSGAANAAFEYDADFAIAVDVSFAMTPGCKPEETGKIGKGPMIGVAPLLDSDISKTLKDIAREKNIPFQTEVMTRRTGTHADEISVTKAGIRTGLVSIPLKYMHTPVEVVDTIDVENCAKLIAEFCLKVAQGGKDNA